MKKKNKKVDEEKTDLATPHAKAAISGTKTKDDLDKLVSFLRFFYSVIFIKNHPLRPIIAQHIKNGTCIKFKEGIEIFKRYPEWQLKKI